MDVLHDFAAFLFPRVLGVEEGDAYGQRLRVSFVHYQDDVVFVEVSMDLDDSGGHQIRSIADVGDGAHVDYNSGEEWENFSKEQGWTEDAIQSCQYWCSVDDEDFE